MTSLKVASRFLHCARATSTFKVRNVRHMATTATKNAKIYPKYSAKSMASQDLVDFLLKLLAIESTTGNEGAFGNFVAEVLTADGWKVERQPLKQNPERFNILATRGNGKPRLILNTHLDTVPPYIPPSHDEKNVYGRGSNDAKGQIACMISAANHLAQINPVLAEDVGLLFVVGEEVDHVGMEAANDLVPDSVDYLIVGEPTELKFATIQKGALKVLLKVNGIAGHSGYPDEGHSAVHDLVEILHDILKADWPKDESVGDTTLNIGLIQGGQAMNAWAAYAQANIFFRVTTSVADIRQRLENAVKNRAEIELLSFNEPAVLSPLPIEAEEAPVAFNTDLPYYNRLDKLKGKYLFGAGSIRNAHSKNEFMPKEELLKCKDTLVMLMQKLLTQN